MTALISLLYPALRPLLFRLAPERAHNLSLQALDSLHRLPGARALFPRPISSPVKLMGLELPNRVGLAAGLDKNGAHIDALGALGFGFIEVGTVTPKAQEGNPKPRLFRLPEHQALINRFGFNNEGLQQFIDNVGRSQWPRTGGILGLNIGKNAQTPNDEAANDYLQGLTAVYPFADYVSINISSPNTENLRDLQQEQALGDLLQCLHQQRLQLNKTHQRRVPLVVKIAPDLNDDQIRQIAAIIKDCHIDGVIATNTTLERTAVAGHQHAQENGGLSGPPVHALSLKVIEGLRTQLGDDFAIIGVGGIQSGQEALEKLQAGANAIQLFTGLIYRGPALIQDCIRTTAQWV